MKDTSEITLETINQLLADYNGIIVNEKSFVEIRSVKSIETATGSDMSFIDRNAKNKENVLANSKSGVVICDFIPEDPSIYASKCLIVVNNPKLFFAKLVNSQLMTFEPFIHPSAVIHPDAKISKTCYIGPNVCIGKSEIGENTLIPSNCSIYDNVIIGNEVLIDAGCVIGTPGFGYVRDDNGVPTRFPQLGGVIIEDGVEIGANVSISKGALQNTVIHKGVKIEALSLIGHNAEIGEYTYIIGASFVAGSVKIGKYCWIASAKIINKISIGDNVTVGLGAVVLESIPSGTTYLGNPAMEIYKYSKLHYKLNKMI